MKQASAMHPCLTSHMRFVTAAHSPLWMFPGPSKRAKVQFSQNSVYPSVQPSTFLKVFEAFNTALSWFRGFEILVCPVTPGTAKFRLLAAYPGWCYGIS